MDHTARAARARAPRCRTDGDEGLAGAPRTAGFSQSASAPGTYSTRASVHHCRRSAVLPSSLPAATTGQRPATRQPSCRRCAEQWVTKQPQARRPHRPSPVGCRQLTEVHQAPAAVVDRRRGRARSKRASSQSARNRLGNRRQPAGLGPSFRPFATRAWTGGTNHSASASPQRSGVTRGSALAARGFADGPQPSPDRQSSSSQVVL